jgi:hypothetical protein
MRPARLLAACLALAASAAVLSFDAPAAAPGAQMSAAAGKFLSTLDDAQKQKVRFAYEAPERIQWHFVPLETRKGVPLKEMTELQREAARQLLATALSEAGYKKADSIMNLEKLLQELEGAGRRWPRDWLLYYVTIFGDPAGSGRWGLSWEGHHLSLNFVVENGKVIASTPQFMGANPATVKTGAATARDTRVLRDEEQLAFDLLAHFAATQRALAVISPEAPKELRGPNDAQPPREPATGLPAAKMSDAQRQLLRKLVETYASAMPEPVAAERLAAIDQAGFENVHFAWLGADKPGVGHGYRVQGPTFLIEFVNTQPDAEGNPANHIHAVFRDLRGDFAIPVQ